MRDVAPFLTCFVAACPQSADTMVEALCRPEGSRVLDLRPVGQRGGVRVCMAGDRVELVLNGHIHISREMDQRTELDTAMQLASTNCSHFHILSDLEDGAKH